MTFENIVYWIFFQCQKVNFISITCAVVTWFCMFCLLLTHNHIGCRC